MSCHYFPHHTWAKRLRLKVDDENAASHLLADWGDVIAPRVPKRCVTIWYRHAFLQGFRRALQDCKIENKYNHNHSLHLYLTEEINKYNNYRYVSIIWASMFSIPHHTLPTTRRTLVTWRQIPQTMTISQQHQLVTKTAKEGYRFGKLTRKNWKSMEITSSLNYPMYSEEVVAGQPWSVSQVRHEGKPSFHIVHQVLSRQILYYW